MMIHLGQVQLVSDIFLWRLLILPGALVLVKSTSS